MKMNPSEVSDTFNSELNREVLPDPELPAIPIFSPC